METGEGQVVTAESKEAVVGHNLPAREQGAQRIAKRGVDATTGESPPANLLVDHLDAGPTRGKQRAQGVSPLGQSCGRLRRDVTVGVLACEDVADLLADGL